MRPYLWSKTLINVALGENRSYSNQYHSSNFSARRSHQSCLGFGKCLWIKTCFVFQILLWLMSRSSGKCQEGCFKQTQSLLAVLLRLAVRWQRGSRSPALPMDAVEALSSGVPRCSTRHRCPQARFHLPRRWLRPDSSGILSYVLCATLRTRTHVCWLATTRFALPVFEGEPTVRASYHVPSAGKHCTTNLYIMVTWQRNLNLPRDFFFENEGNFWISQKIRETERPNHNGKNACLLQY